MSERTVEFERAAKKVLNEAYTAEQKFGAGYASAHEFFGVLDEEVNEFRDAMRSNKYVDMAHEAIQIAAVALRFVECIHRLEMQKRG